MGSGADVPFRPASAVGVLHNTGHDDKNVSTLRIDAFNVSSSPATLSDPCDCLTDAGVPFDGSSLTTGTRQRSSTIPAGELRAPPQVLILSRTHRGPCRRGMRRH